ncbi:MAG: DUF3160 domain-containing protein, partial [Myxococcota bacterium]
MTPIALRHESMDKVERYFRRVAHLMKVLAHISRRQLSGAAFSPDEQAFLNATTEVYPGYGEAPMYDGWYFQLFYDTLNRDDITQAAWDDAHFISDIQTSAHDARIAYVGARGPRMGVFAIDTGQTVQVAVGPVAHGYQYTGGLHRRQTDESARTLRPIEHPWADSYTAPSLQEPPLTFVDAQEGVYNEDTLAVLHAQSRRRMTVTFTLLNHHREPMGSATVTLGRRPKTIPIRRDPSTPTPTDDPDAEPIAFPEV